MAIKVGCLGADEFTFGYMAMKQYFAGNGVEIEHVKCSTHLNVCEQVGRKRITLGVIAIENTLDGVVPETARAVEQIDSEYGLKIQGEIILPIQLFFANKSGNRNDVKKIISHPSALGQCNYFVAGQRAEGISDESRNSTSDAAREASEDESIAVLASKEAVSHYGLKLLLEESKTNHPTSTTRFWVVGREYADSTGDDKTCFLINLEQSQPGSLQKTFKAFADERINVYVVYPIPLFGRRWEYTFLIEVKGHISDDAMRRALDRFKQERLSVHPITFLGSYPNKSGF